MSLTSELLSGEMVATISAFPVIVLIFRHYNLKYIFSLMWLDFIESFSVINHELHIINITTISSFGYINSSLQF